MNWRRFVDETPFGFIVWRVVNRYGEDFISIRAGTLAYFVFFSIFPLMLLLISLIGFFVDYDKAQSVTFGLLQEFPAAVRDLIVANVTGAFALRGPVTIIGLVTLAWSTLQVFFAINYALNSIWDSPERRPWYVLYLRALGIAGLCLILAVVTLVAETTWQVFGTMIQPWLPPGAYDSLLRFTAYGLSLAGSFALFLAIYHWVPFRRVGWRYLWPGALLATILWKISQSAFAWYLRTLSRNVVVYGSIGVIISLMLWLWVSSLILLLGAELNRARADWHAHAISKHHPASD